MIKLSGMWKPKGDSKVMLSGKLGFNGILILLKNEYKEKDTDPDYTLWLKEDVKKQEEPSTEAF